MRVQKKSYLYVSIGYIFHGQKFEGILFVDCGLG